MPGTDVPALVPPKLKAAGKAAEQGPRVMELVATQGGSRGKG